MRRNTHLAVIAGFVLSAVLLAAGGLLLWGSTYTHNMVHNQLAAQQPGQRPLVPSLSAYWRYLPGRSDVQAGWREDL